MLALPILLLLPVPGLPAQTSAQSNSGETFCIVLTDSTRLCLSAGLGLSVDTGGYRYGGYGYGLEHGHSLTLTLLLHDSRTIDTRRLRTGVMIQGLLGLVRRQEYSLPRDSYYEYEHGPGHHYVQDGWIRHNLLYLGPSLTYRIRSLPLEVIVSCGFNWSTWEMQKDLYFEGFVRPNDGHSLLIVIRNRDLFWAIGWHVCQATAHYTFEPVGLRSAMVSIALGFVY
jgi:hypothetical protein